MRPLHSQRKHALVEAMGHVGIGKAWRKKVKKMPSEEATRFEEYFQKRAKTDHQWAKAWERFTVARVTITLEGKW
jgi:hypothetical protein